MLHQDEPTFPDVNFNAFNPVDPATNDRVDVQDDHYKCAISSLSPSYSAHSFFFLLSNAINRIVREIGAASTVLLKNVDSALPLWKPRRIALIGKDPHSCDLCVWAFSSDTTHRF